MKTGDLFRAIIAEKRTRGKIFVISDSEVYLCQNKTNGFSCEHKLGYKYSWLFKPKNSHFDQSVEEFVIITNNNFDMYDLIENNNDSGKVIFVTDDIVIYENELVKHLFHILKNNYII